MSVNVNPLDVPDENTSFTPREWKYFLQELKMRGIEKVDACINNAHYLAKLERAGEQVRNGQIVVKTWEELEAMAR